MNGERVLAAVVGTLVGCCLLLLLVLAMTVSADRREESCSGLLVKTPDGYVCTELQQAPE